MLTAEQPPGSTQTLLDPGHGSGAVRRTLLPSGLRIITETMPDTRSAAFGIWAATGSRDEPSAWHGASHFCEHVLFKGTQRHSAELIAAEIDASGGESNAMTGKEFTYYYARVLDEDLPSLAGIICSMITSALITPQAVDTEREVILAELAMQRDQPTLAAGEEFARALFGDDPLARPPGGSPDTIRALTRADIAAFHAERYRPENLVVTAAGSVEHERIVDLVTAGFQDRFGTYRAGARTLRSPAAPVRPPEGRHTVLPRSVAHATVRLGVPGIGCTDDRRYPLAVLAAILGGGQSSRLFREIRSRRGLAYSVGCHAQSYADTGLLAVHADCRPDDAPELFARCRDELHALAHSGVTEAELARGKRHARGQLVLSLEGPLSRMNRLGQAEIYSDPIISVGDTISTLERLTGDEVGALASDLLNQPVSSVLAGPFSDDDAHLPKQWKTPTI